MFKNVAGQFVIVYAWDSANGVPKEGDAAQITGRVSKDSIDSAATNDANPTELANAPGQYAFLMTAAETNCDLFGLTATSSTADIDIQPVIIYTRTLAAEDIMTTQMTESYAADGTAPTPAQALFMIQQLLSEFVIAGTEYRINKLDGSTQAATLLLNDNSNPSGATRDG